jgi:hypothetical protein
MSLAIELEGGFSDAGASPSGPRTGDGLVAGHPAPRSGSTKGVRCTEDAGLALHSRFTITGSLPRGRRKIAQTHLQNDRLERQLAPDVQRADPRRARPRKRGLRERMPLVVAWRARSWGCCTRKLRSEDPEWSSARPGPLGYRLQRWTSSLFGRQGRSITCRASTSIVRSRSEQGKTGRMCMSVGRDWEVSVGLSG